MWKDLTTLLDERSIVPQFPDDSTAQRLLPEITYPDFFTLTQEPELPSLEDVESAARQAVSQLELERISHGDTVALGLGSRGITDVVPAAVGIVTELQSRGYDVVAIPAMGSHGGADAAGQRKTLASLGLDEATLGCPIDARMETRLLEETELGNEVHVSKAALAADGICVLNRIKPHTNFVGAFESGLTKMICIGLGKRRGAQAIHQRAIVDGYEATFRTTFDLIDAQTTVLGGVAIVENFVSETAEVTGISASALPDAESPLLERAYDYLPTLPFDDLDVLIVDKIGKEISGAGMDPNVTGRYRLPNMDDPPVPDITRIVVRGLTEATDGNAMGIGLADVTVVDVIEQVDLESMYANALTSGSIQKVGLPLAMPNDERAFQAALSAIGSWDPATVRIAWVASTSSLAQLHVSPALAKLARDRDDLVVGDRYHLAFDNGSAHLTEP